METKEEINFKQDQQIMNKKKPNCATPRCNNLAMVLVGDAWICGECCIKLQQKRSKMIFEELQDLGDEK